MSTPASAPPPPPQVPPPVHAPAVGTSSTEEIKIISHSNLFYWWPVWAVGFLMALLTFIDGYRMAIVPAGAKAQRNWPVVISGDTPESREGIILGKGKHLFPPEKEDSGEMKDPEQPHLYVASRSSY